jgi:hypothetical protein
MAGGTAGDRRAPDPLRWEWQRSADEGQTWELLWAIDDVRRVTVVRRPGRVALLPLADARR